MTEGSGSSKSCSECSRLRQALQQVLESTHARAPAHYIAKKALAEWFCVCGAPLEGKDAICQERPPSETGAVDPNSKEAISLDLENVQTQLDVMTRKYERLAAAAKNYVATGSGASAIYEAMEDERGELNALPAQKREWRFDRYRNGRLMAEGVTVHTVTEAEAWEKAESLKRQFQSPTDELRLSQSEGESR